jgi:hypothetical protein
MKSCSRLRGFLRNFGIHRVTLPAFRRNPQQWFVAGFSSHPLKVIEVVLRCRRGHHSNYRCPVPASQSNVALPRSGTRIVVNQLKTLRPEFSFRLISDDQPYPVSFREIFQCAGNRMSLHEPARFSGCKKTVWLRFGDFDLLTEPASVTPSHCPVDDRCNQACANCQRYCGQCHSLPAYAGIAVSRQTEPSAEAPSGALKALSRQEEMRL